MIEFILSLPTWVGCGLAMISTSVFGFAVYFVFYKFISKHEGYELKDPVNNVFRVVGLLVGLMLALAFSEVISELKTIRRAVQQETVVISDAFEVLKLYDIDKTRRIRAILIEYSKAVINDEWPALANDKLSPQVDYFKKQFVEAATTLKPVNSTQEVFRSHIFADLDSLNHEID